MINFDIFSLHDMTPIDISLVGPIKYANQSEIDVDTFQDCEGKKEM